MLIIIIKITKVIVIIMTHDGSASIRSMHHSVRFRETVYGAME